MYKKLTEMMEEIGFKRAQLPGMPDDICMYPMSHDGFAFITVMKYDKENKILEFESSPRLKCSKDAKEIALDIINGINAVLKIGHMEFVEKDDGCYVRSRAAGYVTEDTLSVELLKELVSESINALNSTQGCVNHYIEK